MQIHEHQTGDEQRIEALIHAESHARPRLWSRMPLDINEHLPVDGREAVSDKNVH